MTVKIWRRTATWLVRLLLLAVLGAIALSITVLTVIPRATHGVALSVLTGSMTPAIPVGSVVIDRPVDPGTLQVGDVATYQKRGTNEYVTHRVVKIDASKSPTLFTFKGDANRGADIYPVPATAIRGKVWFHMPYLGAIRDALHTKGGLAGVAMLVLAGYALYQGRSALRERRSPAQEVVVTRDPAAGRYSVLMTLRSDMFDGLSPDSVACTYGGTVVDKDDDTFTLLIGQVDRARDALELIDALELSETTSHFEAVTV